MNELENAIRELKGIERIATKRGPAGRLDLANISLMASRARMELERLAPRYLTREKQPK